MWTEGGGHRFKCCLGNFWPTQHSTHMGIPEVMLYPFHKNPTWSRDRHRIILTGIRSYATFGTWVTCIPVLVFHSAWKIEQNLCPRDYSGDPSAQVSTQKVKSRVVVECTVIKPWLKYWPKNIWLCDIFGPFIKWHPGVGFVLCKA